MRGLGFRGPRWHRGFSGFGPAVSQWFVGASVSPLARRLADADHGGIRILVTGHRGQVGGPVLAHLGRLRHDVADFGRADGGDLLDLGAVKRVAQGCDAIVHLGALAHDSAGGPNQIMAVNMLGTLHVLLAAAAAAVTRVVHFSSVQVFGTAECERLPDYFPVDDEHPRRTSLSLSQMALRASGRSPER